MNSLTYDSLQHISHPLQNTKIAQVIEDDIPQSVTTIEKKNTRMGCLTMIFFFFFFVKLHCCNMILKGLTSLHQLSMHLLLQFMTNTPESINIKATTDTIY